MIPLGVLACAGRNSGPPAGAFPEVKEVAKYSGAAANSHPVILPTSIPGDLLILHTSSLGSSTLTLPEGWTLLANVRPNTTARGVWAYRVVSPGDASVATIGQSASVRMAAMVTAIRSGTYQGVPEIATASGSSSDGKYSPELTPSWGAVDNLWLAMFSTNSDPVINEWPYATGRESQHGISGSCMMCSRELNAASEYPGVWVPSPDYSWAAATIGVRGA